MLGNLEKENSLSEIIPQILLFCLEISSVTMVWKSIYYWKMHSQSSAILMKCMLTSLMYDNSLTVLKIIHL